MSCQLDEQTVVLLVLWSLLRWERKVGLVTLEKMGINLDSFAQEVNQALCAAWEDARQRKCQAGLPGQKVVLVDFQPREQFLLAAQREAAHLSHNYVGSEHLLLAAIQMADPRLGAVLEKYAVTYERAKATILQLLHG